MSRIARICEQNDDCTSVKKSIPHGQTTPQLDSPPTAFDVWPSCSQAPSVSFG